jgi:ABC-type uncharacterized transport system substrate-binding protein
MRRREFIALVGGAVAVVPFRTVAQVPKQRAIVAFLGAGTLTGAGGFIGALRTGLEELGYAEGRNIELIPRMAENQIDRLPALAEEVVRLRPAVIAAGAVDAVLAAKKVTSTIPIVSGALADAEHLGLVATYSRPGGNVTGITPYIAGLPAKQIEIAREVVPGGRKIGLLANLNDPKAPPQRDELRNVAEQLGAAVIVPEVLGPGEVAGAIQALASERVDVIIVLQTTMLLSQRRAIAEEVAKHRLPTVYGYREHVDEGGLISYGVNLRWCWHRLATFVHKILNGSSPAELPVEFPPRLQMVVNLKTAKALGLAVPPTLLARADEVIE